jgi:hypothetical protein
MAVATKKEAGLSLTRSGEVFFESPEDNISTLLLALLCHSQAVAGSELSCNALTAARATLLVPYPPARVNAVMAERAAVDTLEAAGVEVLAAHTLDTLDEEDGDDPAIVDLCDETDSPDAFRDRLRVHLLASIQKQGRIGDDWLSSSPETHLGGGGGGT